jgi:hypothetical protein
MLPRALHQDSREPPTLYNFFLIRHPCTPSPVEPADPSLNAIPPNDDEPAPRTHHRYPLRSQPRTGPNHIAANVMPTQQANAVVFPVTGQVQECRQLIKGPHKPWWTHSLSNEFGRLAQGVGIRMPTGTDTIHFVRQNQVPKDRQATCGQVVCNKRPQKEEICRTRVNVGGDRLDYPDKVSTPTSSLTTVECLVNSIISAPKAKGATGDPKDFYLGTPLDRHEFMRMHVDLFPEEIIIQHNLRDIVSPDGWIHASTKSVKECAASNKQQESWQTSDSPKT